LNKNNIVLVCFVFLHLETLLALTGRCGGKAKQITNMKLEGEKK
jgi:hypothetical protein